MPANELARRFRLPKDTELFHNREIQWRFFVPYGALHKFISLLLLPCILNGQYRTATAITKGMFAELLQPQILRYHHRWAVPRYFLCIGIVGTFVVPVPRYFAIFWWYQY